MSQFRTATEMRCQINDINRVEGGTHKPLTDAQVKAIYEEAMKRAIEIADHIHGNYSHGNTPGKCRATLECVMALREEMEKWK